MHPIEAFKGRQTQNLVLRKLLLADAAKKEIQSEKITDGLN